MKWRIIVVWGLAGALLLLSGSSSGDGAPTDATGMSEAQQTEPDSLLPGGPTIGNCPVLPPDNPWNTRVNDLPVHPDSDQIIARMAPNKGLHRDWGPKWAGALNGIPFHVVGSSQAMVDIFYGGPGVDEAYADESDCGPMPIPADATVEGSTGWNAQDGDDDRHVLVIDVDACLLYELYLAKPNRDGTWNCGTSAVYDLTSNRLRPIGWTSADAAGLPILPGLARWDEVKNAVAVGGDFGHALRFTMEATQRAFILPATLFASSSTDPFLPPMGLRVRLKKSFDISGFSPKNRALLRTLKRYGMMLADNGGDWFISGVPDEKPCDPGDVDCTSTAGRWTSDEHSQLKDKVHGSDFEVVWTGKTYDDWSGVEQAAAENSALQPRMCRPPMQSGLACACYE